MKYRIYFFKEADGTKPLAQFIKTLDLKLKAKVVTDLHLLEELGNLAREPLSKPLDDGIFELRTIEGGNIVRILYFFDRDKIIVATTNGFVKKTRKTPPNEIALAKERRQIYFSTRERYIND